MKATPILPHGGSGQDFLEAHFPDAPRPWLDLSTGINPWPYPHQATADASWHTLPSPSLYRACREAAANYFGVDPRNVAILPGSQAAISLIPRLFEPTSVAVLDPTYGEHSECWRQAGHRASAVSADRIATENSEILVITNPNNPDGRFWEAAEIEALCKARSAWTIVDEAFADVLPSISAASACADGSVIVLRSFGKFFGLAGARLGFALAPEDMARRIEEMIGPWAVSGPALETGARAYGDRDWQSRTRVQLKQAMSALHALATKYELNFVGGTDLFVLVEHPRAPELFDTLCRCGIYVRRFAYPCWLRLGLSADTEAAQRLDEAFRTWAARA